MDLSQLATILRENGDQVLNGISKLSLSTKLLNELNNSFSLIIEEREALSSTFQVISASNSKVELLLDLQFLHDFVQRTVGLKLIDEHSGSCDQVNISKFKYLKLLEIRKIPIIQISGLQSLRNQLQYIICVRCLNNLKELFIECGQDKSSGFVWTELREAVLSYNHLESIDNSLEYVPWLQVLDLSHNSIVNAQPLICLPNLKHLNLGFNHLESVPIFKRESARHLQVLMLKGNYIEDLTGLLLLDNLVTLDLSCNCLVDHIYLKPLPHLAALQWLCLEGNPLSFHPNHRAISAQYLHSNTATVKFILDRSLLSKSEKLLTGTFYATAKLTRMYHTSISSNVSDMTNSSEITTIAASELTRSQSFQRGRKVRDAVISETEECTEIMDSQNDIVNPEMLASVNSTSSINILSDHVETQRKIKSLRDQYGENWLKNQSGSIMQDILGMEKTTTSTPYEQDFMKHAAELFERKPEVAIEHIAEADSTEVMSDISANNTFVTASENSFFEDRDMITSVSPSISSDEEHNEDGEEHLYLAQFKQEEIFIVLTDKYIKERDTSTGRIRAKWLLEVIVSCEKISNKPSTVLIEFDTVRRNMKTREYVLEEDESEKLLRAISQITSQRSLSALNQTVFSCMKCSSQFSQYKDTTMQITGASKYLPACPTCGSSMVYEVEEELTPTNRHFNGNGKMSDRPESPSECSIASETENNPLLAQIHVMADVHMDSSAFPANNSAESVQESNSSHITIDNVPRKYESDIEVISNPSQSSIEVLDDHMRPGRKRSSEERKTITAPSLVTIPDVVTPIATLAGLTESSSSSSFTESICTAYDTHTSRPASGLEDRPTIPEEKKEEKVEVKSSIISSIIEGLFSGPTTGTKSNMKQDDVIVFDINDDFINIDHRVKYYLYQHIFEDEHENFVWLLRCFVLNVALGKPVDGCLVLSTHRVYILIIKEENMGQELSDWLLKKESYTIDRLQTVFALPWKQGIGLEIRNIGNTQINHLCLLQDMQRTSTFLAFLTENPVPDSCDLVCATPEQPMLNLQHLLLTHHSESANKDTSLCILSVFSKCAITNTEKNALTFGVFLVTAGDLILLEDTLWLLPESNKEPKIFNSQPISNLLEVVLDDLILEFHFLDEVVGCEEIWTIKWSTVDTVGTVISAVRAPWEEIFSVPLQVNHKVHSA